ncbi:MAG: Imm26 family immunity protein [Mucilaginibacter sp.]
MARKRFKSGDILQIPLPHNLGFAYAQGINMLKDDINARYPAIIRVYNYRSALQDAPLENFVKKELILSPLLIGGILPVLRKEVWKIIGHVPLQEKDRIIPHYKKGPGELNATQWYYLIDADISKKVKSTFDNVKHLETIGATGSELVGTKIAMALLRDEGKRIEDYFELNEYYEKHYYNEVMEIPAFYTQPEFMQGKAII